MTLRRGGPHGRAGTICRHARTALHPQTGWLSAAVGAIELAHPRPNSGFLALYRSRFKMLLRDFDNIEIESLETPGRDLFPINYNALAQCNKTKQTSDGELKFHRIT